MKGIIIVIAISTILYSCGSKKEVISNKRNALGLQIKRQNEMRKIDSYVREINKIIPNNEDLLSEKESNGLTNEILKNISDKEAFYNDDKIIKINVYDLFVNNYKRNIEFFYKNNNVVFIKTKQISLLKKDAEIITRRFYYTNGILISDSIENESDNTLLLLAENSLKEKYKNYN